VNKAVNNTDYTDTIFRANGRILTPLLKNINESSDGSLAIVIVIGSPYQCTAGATIAAPIKEIRKFAERVQAVDFSQTLR